ncbi:MAG: CPBP family intramembrane metalloprotease [Gemmatimonadota bacterium]
MTVGHVEPLRPGGLVLLFGVPTVLNAVACLVAIPLLDAWGRLPIEVSYFLSVGLLVLAPMFVGALVLSGREAGSYRLSVFLPRMRVRRIRSTDWTWIAASFAGLSLASFLIARILMPRLGMDAKPFFFRDMPLGREQMWLLAVWPVFFFFNIFGEEFLWRGYIQPRQELLTGRWTWLVHGLLWALWHTPMGLDLIVASLPIFFILPAMVQITENTSTAIVVHAAFGAFGFLALALGLLR